MRSGHWLTASRNRPSGWQTRSMPEVITLQTEHDPVAARADLQAVRLQPAGDGKGPQAPQVFQHAVAGRGPAPRLRRRASQCRHPRRAGPSLERRIAGASPSAKPARTIGSLRVPVDGDLHDVHGAAALGIGHSQRHGVQAGLLESVRRRVARRRRPVAEVPGRRCRPFRCGTSRSAAARRPRADAEILTSGRSFSPAA